MTGVNQIGNHRRRSGAERSHLRCLSATLPPSLFESHQEIATSLRFLLRAWLATTLRLTMTDVASMDASMQSFHAEYLAARFPSFEAFLSKMDNATFAYHERGFKQTGNVSHQGDLCFVFRGQVGCQCAFDRRNERYLTSPNVLQSAARTDWGHSMFYPFPCVLFPWFVRDALVVD